MNKKENDFAVFRNPQAERFALILAGGDGIRLRHITKRLTGCESPKQFCSLLGDEPLLTVTQKRIAPVFSRENIFYSLTETHEKFYRPVLSGTSRKNMVIQPSNKGTAPAILYSLLRLAKINPQATVAFFPSDHYISVEKIFMYQVKKAFVSIAKKPEAVILIGIEPLSPKTSYGWIEPCGEAGIDSIAEIQKVKRFWEKPTSSLATELMAKGCLWNSFVMVGKVQSFLDLFKKYLPNHYKLFCLGNLVLGTFAERMTMKTIYGVIESRNFSFDILEKCQEELFVLRSGGFVWSDLGEPQEVLLKMAQLGLKNKLFPLAV